VSPVLYLAPLLGEQGFPEAPGFLTAGAQHLCTYLSGTRPSPAVSVASICNGAEAHDLEKQTPVLETVTRHWTKDPHSGGSLTRRALGTLDQLRRSSLTTCPTLHLVTGHLGLGAGLPGSSILDYYWQGIPSITLCPAPKADVSQATSLP
jgi:hypothetical protein